MVNRSRDQSTDAPFAPDLFQDLSAYSASIAKRALQTFRARGHDA